MNDSRSYQRTLVDENLARRGTDLGAYVEAGRAEGKSIEEIWLELRVLTGVPFTSRTLYRWLDSIEARAS